MPDIDKDIDELFERVQELEDDVKDLKGDSKHERERESEDEPRSSHRRSNEDNEPEDSGIPEVYAHYSKKEDGFVCDVPDCKDSDAVFNAGEIIAHGWKAHKVHPDDESHDIKGFTEDDFAAWEKFKKRKGFRVPKFEQPREEPEEILYANALVKMSSGQIRVFHTPYEELPLSVQNYFSRLVGIITNSTFYTSRHSCYPKRDNDTKCRAPHKESDEGEERGSKRSRKDEDEDDSRSSNRRADEDKPSRGHKEPSFSQKEIDGFQRKFGILDSDMKLVVDWAEDEQVSLKDAAIEFAFIKGGKAEDEEEDSSKRKKHDEDDDEEEPRRGRRGSRDKDDNEDDNEKDNDEDDEEDKPRRRSHHGRGRD